VAHAAPDLPESAQRLRAARKAWGWSQHDLVREVERVRSRRGLEPIVRDSISRQIKGFEQGAKPGPLWRQLLAEALQEDEDHLLGLTVDAALPRPLLVQTPVNADVLAVILAQREAHIRAEHLFGPDYARALVDRDLVTIEKLLRNAPSNLRYDVRRAAGRIAELGGWIAQDSGDPVKADQLTRRAEDHLRAAADPVLRAMIAMRRSNILLMGDPTLAVDLAGEAAQLIDGRSVGRLRASIARQQALAAMADHDRASFVHHAARALDVAQTEPVADDHAVYATRAYVASEIALGFNSFGEPEKALELLLEHHTSWPDDQQRDYTVACARLLRTFIALHDYHSALDHVDRATRTYQATPSDRARRELRLCRKIIRDRARADRSLPLHTLRKRIEAALQGDPQP
jgi:tetratricopeptide (TPR) repeat protein